MSFTLSIYPWVYQSKYTADKKWSGDFIEKEHKTPEQESQLEASQRNDLLKKRNSFPDLPLVNYTTQYGMGCFEGLKAFPQKNGELKLFRPDENAKRMARSMEGLKMPSFPPEIFMEAVKGIVKKNQDMGFAPKYDAAWEKGNFSDGHAVYLRPFTYSEPAIGLGLSQHPWFLVVSTPVGSYFRSGNSKAITTNKVRATEFGTGWIKCDSNYVIPTLAKKEAEADGYMEAIFLDAKEKKFVEEGSSCNIFFLMKNGTLVTPRLGDTILPGITRKSVLTLAQDFGVETEERQVDIEEVMDQAVECFVTGTAAGVSYLESITHQGKTTAFNNGKMGDLSREMLTTLKGIQYGAIEDKHNWMFGLD